MKKTSSHSHGVPQLGGTAYDYLKSLSPAERDEVLKDCPVSFSDIQQRAEMMNALHPDAH